MSEPMATPGYRPRTWTPGHRPAQEPGPNFVAWAAGLFNAKGTVTQAYLRIRTTDEATAERLHRNFGGTLNGPYLNRAVTYWNWMATGARGRWLAEHMQPWLRADQLERLTFYGWFRTPARRGRPPFARRSEDHEERSPERTGAHEERSPERTM